MPKQHRRFLADLQSHRVRADYHLDNAAVETAKFARQCVEQARQIEADLQAARRPS